MISNVVTTAPGVYVLSPIDNNFSIPSDNSVTAGTAVVMRKGVVGKPFTVTKENWEQLCGKPLPMAAGTHAEGMRHLVDALNDAARVEVVRVISADAKYPALTFKTEADSDPLALVATATALTYGTDVTLGTGEFMAVWPVDGDPCEADTVKVVISEVDTVTETFSVQFQRQVTGSWVVSETYTASLNPEAKDDLNRTMYLPAMLEERASNFRAMVTPVSFSEMGTVDAVFSGGTNGSTPTNEEFIKAWELFKDPQIKIDAMFAGGQYEATVLAECIAIANGKLAQFRYDAPPALTETAAIEWMKTSALNSYQAQCYHYPYKATDLWFGGKALWGVSGSATASKARCFNTPTGRVDVRGAHFTNAGEKRGLIGRRNVEPLHFTGKADPVDLVKARLNPVTNGSVIGDCLTVWNQENYLRFEHVGAILNDLSHDFLIAANIAKFEPDGLTKQILTDLSTDLCQKRVQSGALVAPRDAGADGSDPFQIKIEQIELDLWQVTISVCPTGVARRIAMQPILIK